MRGVDNPECLPKTPGNEGITQPDLPEHQTA
jgi:hypothetical protein